MYSRLLCHKADLCVVYQVQMQIGNNYGIPNVVDHTDNSPSFAHIQSQQPVHMQHGVAHTLDFQPAADVNMRRLNSNPMPFPRTAVETFDVGQAQVSLSACPIASSIFACSPCLRGGGLVSL